jgi:hypothetical protein
MLWREMVLCYIGSNGAHRRGISEQATGCTGNTHNLGPIHVSSLFISNPLSTTEAFKLLDGLHMDSVYTEGRDGLDINNN